MRCAITDTILLQASVDFLDRLDIPFFKIASNDVDSIQYMEHAAQKGRALFVSSGMQNLETMVDVYKLLKEVKAKFCFMQCTSCYPSAPQDVHLRVIKVSNQSLCLVRISLFQLDVLLRLNQLVFSGTDLPRKVSGHSNRIFRS